MNMVSGVIIGIMIAAVGAVLDFAVTASPYQHGFNVNTIGVILMVVGIVGIVLSLLFGLRSEVGYRGWGGYRRHRTVVDDGHGNVASREDSYL